MPGFAALARLCERLPSKAQEPTGACRHCLTYRFRGGIEKSGPPGENSYDDMLHAPEASMATDP
jgi:hypothetical protein